MECIGSIDAIKVRSCDHTQFYNMTTAALPALDPLFRRSAKRTRDVFASAPEDGLKDEEKR